VRARVCRWPRPGERTSNFYAQYSTGKHEAALCLWNAKNGEKNPDNVPEQRAHRVTHKTSGGGGGGRRAGPTVTAAYSVIPPPRAAPIRWPGISQCRTPPVFRSPMAGNTVIPQPVYAARRTANVFSRHRDRTDVPKAVTQYY